MTADIDILIAPTLANAKRTLAALVDVVTDVNDLTPEEMLSKKVLLRQYILGTDIHPSLGQGVHFDTVWRGRVKSAIEGAPVFVASLDDLIRMKRAANRPKDRLDLIALLAIKKRTKSNKS